MRIIAASPSDTYGYGVIFGVQRAPTEATFEVREDTEPVHRSHYVQQDIALRVSVEPQRNGQHGSHIFNAASIPRARLFIALLIWVPAMVHG